MEEEMSAYFVLNNVRLWVKGTIYQGEVILELNEKQSNYMQNLLETPKKDLVNVSDWITLHQQFFISSLNQAREWIKEGINHDPNIEELLNIIDDKFPEIKEVRNMNEHDIDYFKNKGHRQKDFVKELKGNKDVSLDATSTIITDNGYFVGGRINVEEVISYFKELQLLIEEKLESI